jgi:putative selenate reductase
LAELYPLSMRHHLRRIFHELRHKDQVYDMPRSRFYVGDAELDTSVPFHTMRASTALGPAAGPQDQLIQNIVLSWLGGSRIIELKTVQILDELKIPRPCISASNIGFNVEWSQELKLDKSLREYVAASMILEILRESDILGLGEEKATKTQTVLDMSVGYDLAGISTPQVTGWIRTMRDATRLIDELRAEIPDEYAQYRDFAFNPRIANSITLSTFHGCPPDEIEKIVRYLLTEIGTHAIIKLNPTQLGKERLEHVLHDVMGYTHLEVNQKAYAAGLSLQEAIDIVERLRPLAEERGLGLGVKFSNTLETVNKGEYFKDEIMYMSGPPLHVIAMNLVGEWRKALGMKYPISFSAGIDHDNFYKAVSLGIVPITVCTDLLKPRGYGRQITYLKNLEERMKTCGAATIPEYIVRARGQGGAAIKRVGGEHEGALLQALERGRPLDEVAPPEVVKRVVEEAALLNTDDYVRECTADPRYHHAKNKSVPKKIGSYLYLWDCISCDKCVPVCPNDANFIYEVPAFDVTYRNLRLAKEGVFPDEECVFKISRTHQIANYADFCNECGNCDTFCPEYGGPYIMKPRFFATPATYAIHADHDGFVVSQEAGALRIAGRIQGVEYSLETTETEGVDRFTDGVLEVEIERTTAKVKSTKILAADRVGHVTDLKNYWQLVLLLKGVTNREQLNYINILDWPAAAEPAPA